jgi:GAF domain-containing protein
MDERQKRALEEIDGILHDVREHLTFSREQGEVYELKALQLLLQVIKSLHSEHDVRALMTMVLDSAISFGEADRAFFMLLTEEGEPRFKMGRSVERTYLTPDDFVYSTSVVNEALNSMSPIILADARTSSFNARDSIQGLELRTIMAAPLRHNGEVLGLIYVDSKRPLTRYSTHHLNVLTSLAEQAAVALHNAQKFDTHVG